MCFPFAAFDSSAPSLRFTEKGITLKRVMAVILTLHIILTLLKLFLLRHPLHGGYPSKLLSDALLHGFLPLRLDPTVLSPWIHGSNWKFQR